MQKQNNPYFPIYHEVACSTSVTNKATGEVLEWNLQEKIFYCWMLAEYKAFQNVKGKLYHNMDVIAGRLGVTTKSVERYVKTLVQIGLIEKDQIKYRGSVVKSNNYVVHDVFGAEFKINSGLSAKDKAMVELLNSDINKVTKQLPNKVQNSSNIERFIEELDDPF